MDDKERRVEYFTIKEFLVGFKRDIHERIDRLEDKLDIKVNQKDCKETKRSTSKLVWGLFGVNIFGIVAVILTLFIK